MFFTKVHGLGNDFILINAGTGEGLPDDCSTLAREMCDRRFGIGADGLVLLLDSEVADVRMKIINSDGSEAEMCGNAIRCVAKYLYEHGIVRKDEIKVETLAGIMVPQIIHNNGEVSAVRVDMGVPRLARADIPMLGPVGQVINEPLEVAGQTFNVTAVSMGNPHCVIFVPDVAAVPLSEIGPLLETHPSFPRKTNVEFVQTVSPGEVRMVVWERGAGPTLACGTGACAVAVAGVLNGYTEKKVTVHLPGGSLFIEWADNGRVFMTGPAEEVFNGEYTVYKQP
ncbi:diaminopimelate epimerase [Desulforamulus hydrothermalis]|uniref:Diaminopimelate epimerase n=1 Tax=Desulforamulus hydrothermalis Lam5 = DSM 18033 TaxID=1121428 RepID=K8EEI5_9FIRM|nr:diaminopimelate epimerase [Desulforamulus hydrothermalis]CCO07196.1 Diaminopimelate epimerase [Desulforamulus hydrothermalis Lam5 = DSM 18033]SHG88052.1 diaminopimelate epimerase [Desulforamulus hydrothermalis Lam5 = DSM 18033]